MTEESFAQNGDTPVTRRECAERHEQSLLSAAQASSSAAKWIKISLSVMALLNAIVLVMFVFVARVASTAELRASDAIGAISVIDQKIKSVADLRRETNDLMFRQLESMEKKLDDLNKAIRDRNQSGS